VIYGIMLVIVGASVYFSPAPLIEKVYVAVGGSVCAALGLLPIGLLVYLILNLMRAFKDSVAVAVGFSEDKHHLLMELESAPSSRKGVAPSLEHDAVPDSSQGVFPRSSEISSENKKLGET
jgi:hypothetical protein